MFSKVTISGRICTGKTTLFWSLYKHLGWPTFSASQYFRDYARTHGIVLETAGEQIPKITKEADLGMQRLLEQESHVIVEGWMAGIMADEIPGVLRIMLTATDEERAKRFAKRENVSVDEAKKRISEREESWFTRLKNIYHRNDFFDPKFYNLIIDTSAQTQAQVAEVVLTKLHEP